jgi:hypothetical protein
MRASHLAPGEPMMTNAKFGYGDEVSLRQTGASGSFISEACSVVGITHGGWPRSGISDECGCPMSVRRHGLGWSHGGRSRSL